MPCLHTFMESVYQPVTLQSRLTVVAMYARGMKDRCIIIVPVDKEIVLGSYMIDVETGFSHLHDFFCPYYIAHVVTREDETDTKARYVMNALRKDEPVGRLYIAPYNTM